MSLELSELREEAQGALERFRGDRFAWFPDWVRHDGPATVQQQPLVFCGRTHAFWTFLRDAKKRGLQVPLIVDDTAAGTQCEGIPVVGTDAWVRFARDNPRTVAVSCPLYLMSGKLHFALAARTHGLRFLDWAQLLRLPGFGHLANGTFNDFVGDLETSVGQYLGLEQHFGDELSKQTLLSLMLYRITLEDRRVLEVARSLESEYFFSGLFHLAPEGEVFVDAGAFDGDTLKKFVRLTEGRFARYVGFEPDAANFQKLVETGKKLLGDDPRLSFHATGLWDRSTELEFLETSEMGSSFAGTPAADQATAQWNIASSAPLQTRVSKVKVVALDEALTGVPPTFIKMDIEGSERQGLAGAARTIQQHRPRLALSAYHLPDDLPTLVRQLKALRPDHRLALRQHWLAGVDTILYAR